MPEDFTASVGRGTLDALSWLFDRAQQGVFHGARSGADAYGAYNTGMQNAGVPASVSDPIAQIGSALPMAWGAAKGLTGWGDHVSGQNLTQDFTGDPELDNAYGSYLNATATPETVFLGGVKLPWLGNAMNKLSGLGVGTTAKTLDELAGQFGRTAKNLWQSQRLQPQTVAKLDERIGNPWSKYFLDVPSSPRSAADIVPIRTAEKPGVFANRMGYKAGGKPINEERARGFNPPDNPNIATYWEGSQRITGRHEPIHWAKHQLPEGLAPQANVGYEALANANPAKVAELRRSPAYKDKTLAGIGDELLARHGYNILDTIGPEGNVLAKVLDMAYSSFQPTNFQNAGPLGIGALPMAYNTVRNLWDNTRSGQ